jgi:succinate-semialdehyde dehydrogenase/glutarate-semialdehyde dehydrogenase
MPLADLMTFFALNTERMLRPEAISLGKYNLLGRTSYVIYKPSGVVGIISPWNFPLVIPGGGAVTALMAGNTVVLKPSELTPLTGMRLGEAFKAAGLPEGVFSILTGDGETGAALARSELNRIIFTGSVATGKKIMAAAAENLVPVVLELGGKDPMIVLRDADLDVASSAAVWGAFANSGQVCASVERCYVDTDVAEDFVARVVEKTKSLSQGDPLSFNTDIGSMASEQQLRIVERHVADAVERGAIVLCGGGRDEGLSGLFFKPTVIRGVDHSSIIVREETFGPVLPIMTFATEDEAVAFANDSTYGLAASVWTRDTARGRKLAARLNAATVMVNECVYSHALPQTPWGGVKSSGLGRTHGRWGLKDLVECEHIHVNWITAIKDFWWYGYSRDLNDVLTTMTKRFTSPSLIDTLRALPALAKGLFLRKR